MENGNTGFALGCFGGIHSKEEHEKAIREYEVRKANADKIEAALMAACTEIAGRLEHGVKGMGNTEIAQAVGTLAGIATVLGALNLYAIKPIEYDFGHTCGCDCDCKCK